MAKLTNEAPNSQGPVKGAVICDRYILEERVGTGGNGDVWRAQSKALGATVAVKFGRTTTVQSEVPLRMEREARTAASLNHPAIVKMLDAGTAEDGTPFVVQEFLDGENLSELIRDLGPLGPIEAVRTLLPIAEALAVTHTSEIVHRDVKLSNILLELKQGGRLQPKLVDFGLAKGTPEAELGDGQVTMAGTVLGSQAYMSPEQALGLDEVTVAADVWSFSVTLFRAVTGKTPFPANNYASTVRAILDSEPKSLQDLGLQEPELDRLIRKGLHKSPEERWPSMRHFGKALAEWLHSRKVADDVTGQSLASSWLGTDGGAVAGLGAVALGSGSSSTLHLPFAGRARRLMIPLLLGAGLICGLAVFTLGLSGGEYSETSRAEATSEVSAVGRASSLRHPIAIAPPKGDSTNRHGAGPRAQAGSERATGVVGSTLLANGTKPTPERPAARSTPGSDTQALNDVKGAQSDTRKEARRVSHTPRKQQRPKRTYKPKPAKPKFTKPKPAKRKGPDFGF